MWLMPIRKGLYDKADDWYRFVVEAGKPNSQSLSGSTKQAYANLHTPDFLFTTHLWKMPHFSALLSKGLYTFLLVVFWLNYDLRVLFYVGFRNFRKNER